MSSVIANVVEIEAVHPHPNADRLFLARIKGWQAVIRKREDGSPEFAPGERVVFIPPDSTLPREMAERIGVVNYLSERTNVEGGRDLVVRQVRLRGEPSFGLVVRPDDPSWPVGTDVREHYGIGKFRPPVRFSAGDAEPNHPLFQRYTDIENLRNFPGVFAPGEEVVVSEKIHGTNARIGWVEGDAPRRLARAAAQASGARGDGHQHLLVPRHPGTGAEPARRAPAGPSGGDPLRRDLRQPRPEPALRPARRPRLRRLRHPGGRALPRLR